MTSKYHGANSCGVGPGVLDTDAITLYAKLIDLIKRSSRVPCSSTVTRPTAEVSAEFSGYDTFPFTISTRVVNTVVASGSAKNRNRE